MNIKTIAEGLSAKFEISELEIKQDEIHLEIDDVAVVIREAGEIFILMGVIGLFPADGNDAFAKVLLENNMTLFNLKATVFALNSQTEEYLLLERITKNDAYDFESFCDCLGKFMDSLERWRGMHKDFLLVSTEAKDQLKTKNDEAVNALRYTYLRV